MNPFLLPSSDRLTEWKKFRNTLPALDELTQFTEVVKFFSKAPLENRSYDITDLKSWPTPWELMNENLWCRDSIAVGMEFTLGLSGINRERMEINHIIFKNKSDERLILKIDQRWILNYDWGSIAENIDDHRVLSRWKYTGRSYTSF